jgi:hypothetical protein
MTKRRRRKYRTRTRENRCNTCGNLRNEAEECQNPFCPLFKGPARKAPAEA